MDLGGFSDYDGWGTGTRNTTPRMQSNITSENENDAVILNVPMSPIHEIHEDEIDVTPLTNDKYNKGIMINNTVLKNKYNSLPTTQTRIALVNNASKSNPTSPFGQTYEYNKYNRHNNKDDGHKRAHTETNHDRKL